MIPASRPHWKYHVGAKQSSPEQKAAATPAHLHPKIAARYAAHISGAAPLPLLVDLDTYSPHPRLNQNVTSGCVDHAYAAMTTTTLNTYNKGLGFIPSPYNLYSCVRGKERSLAQVVSPGTVLPKLQDAGSQVATVMWVGANIGVLPMRGPTPDGYNSDVWSGNVLDEPALQDIEAAGQKLLIGPYIFDLTAPNISDVMAASLAANIAIQIAFECDDAYQELQPGQIAVAPVDAPDDGGHSVGINGYYTLDTETQGIPAGTRIFWTCGSWGDDYDENGRSRVGPAFMGALWEAWAVAITAQGSVS